MLVEHYQPVRITKTDKGSLYVTCAAPAVEMVAGAFIPGSIGLVNDLEIAAVATGTLNGPVFGNLVNNGTFIPSGDCGREQDQKSPLARHEKGTGVAICGNPDLERFLRHP